MKSLCGMLNGTGGRVLIGVTEAGKIVGQTVSNATLKGLAHAYIQFEPPAGIRQTRVQLANGLGVFVIDVDLSPSTPHTFHGRPYRRLNSTTSIMPQPEYQRRLLERDHSTLRWENRIARGSPPLDMSEVGLMLRDSVAANRLDSPITDPVQALERLKLTGPSGITQAANVAFAVDPFPDFPQCALRPARFKGITKAEFVDQQQLTGHAFKLLREADIFLRRHLPVAGRFESSVLERIDEPLFPPLALREALVNAFIHRDYSIVGGAVSVAVYDDRLEIASSGTLPFGLTIADLSRDHQSRPRNPLLADLFYRRGLIEKWGRGTQKIIDLCVAAGHPAPQFEEQAGDIVVRIIPSDYVPPHRVELSLTDRQRRILHCLRDGRQHALREIQAALTPRLATQRVRDDLNFLNKLESVDHSGHGRGSFWWFVPTNSTGIARKNSTRNPKETTKNRWIQTRCLRLMCCGIMRDASADGWRNGLADLVGFAAGPASGRGNSHRMTGSSGLKTEVLQVLNRLRGRIRRYVFLEGLALVLCLVGLTFWLSVALDYGFELPRGARRVYLVLAASGFVMAALWYIVLRLIRGIQHRSLALILERRFPELNESLITSVDLAQGKIAGPPLTETMLQRTMNDAAQLLQKLRLGEVFNTGPLIRSVGGALLLLMSIAGFGFASGDVFQTWYRRNVLFTEEFYHRQTDLRVFVFADPGERPVDFQNGVYKHPRGADLALAVEVAEGKLVPKEVNYRYRSVATSGAGDGYMTRVGDRMFRQKLSGLKDSVRLSIRGGDFKTRSPLLVEVVDPPQIDRITLQCIYPPHTGLNSRDEDGKTVLRTPVDVLGAQVSLPAGTDVLLNAKLNKPLVNVRLQTDRFELLLDRNGGGIRLTGDGQADSPVIPLPFEQPPLQDDGRALIVPVVLSHQVEPAVLDSTGKPNWPLVLPSDAALKMWLHDTDDILSAEPIRLTLNAIPDQPPQVDVRLKGIGTSITRQATIPLVGQIRDAEESAQVYGMLDDYGVVEARFDYRIEGGAAAPSDTFRSRPFTTPAAGRTEVPITERFSVLELDVAVGQKLLLKAVAKDGDQLTGPHESSSALYNFQIVSDDELLALVAVKELNVRRRFEQILEEMRNTRKDMLLQRTRLEEARPLRNVPQEKRTKEEAEKLAVLETAALTSVERGISGIRKNHNETRSIEEEFKDIHDELENNAIPDVRPMLERIETGIVKPLSEVNRDNFNDCDDLLIKLREALEQQEDPIAPFEAAGDQLAVTIEKLEAVLAQMLKNEDYNKVLEMLRAVIKGQEDLKKQTEIERKKKLIEGLK